ncbi:MAG: HD domain-containing protein [Thermoplasmatota archaeon]
MKTNHKIIRDSIHGNIKVDGFFIDLIETPEIQRLCGIKQLGLAHLVFPGAHHTRLEHSLGTFHMAAMLTESLPLDVDEKTDLMCAALLHDIGHGPFSHTLESILRDSLHVDHVELTKRLVLGEYSIFHDDEQRFHLSSPFNSVNEVLVKQGIDTNLITQIIGGAVKKKPYLGQLLSSVIDVDQLDYLLRDSYYTGVAYGMIDSQRFFQTIGIHDNHLAIHRKGVAAVESVLMARALMYSSVYFHKTVRIAEIMLSKAIELIPDIDPLPYFKMTDAELVNALKQKGSYQHEIVTRLKYRQLFKQAYVLSAHQRDDQTIRMLKRFDDSHYRRNMEQTFEEVLHIPKGHVIIDVPERDLHLSEPRILEIDIPVVDDAHVEHLSTFTPVADAIRSRSIPDWDIMIITDEHYRNTVMEHAPRLLLG